METLSAENPGVAIASLGLCGSIIVALIGVVTFFWKRSKSQEAKAWQSAVDAIKDGLHDVRDSIYKSVERFEHTFKEVFGRLGDAEKKISHIEGRCELHRRGIWKPKD